MRMYRLIAVVVLGSALMANGLVIPAGSAEKVIQTQKAKDLVITLMS